MKQFRGNFIFGGNIYDMAQATILFRETNKGENISKFFISLFAPQKIN